VRARDALRCPEMPRDARSIEMDLAPRSGDARDRLAGVGSILLLPFISILLPFRDKIRYLILSYPFH